MPQYFIAIHGNTAGTCPGGVHGMPCLAWLNTSHQSTNNGLWVVWINLRSQKSAYTRTVHVYLRMYCNSSRRPLRLFVYVFCFAFVFLLLKDETNKRRARVQAFWNVHIFLLTTLYFFFEVATKTKSKPIWTQCLVRS